MSGDYSIAISNNDKRAIKQVTFMFSLSHPTAHLIKPDANEVGTDEFMGDLLN